MASVMSSATGGPLVDSRWLWGLRIATAVFLLPLVALGAMIFRAGEESAPWALLWGPAVIYGLILWGLRTNPPHKLAVAVAVAIGTIPFALLLLAAVTSTATALDALKYFHFSEPFWGGLALVQVALFVSAVGAYLKLSRNRTQTLWMWSVRILAGASVLLAILTFAEFFKQFRQLDTWVTPTDRVLVLLGTVLLYGWVLWFLHAPSPDFPKQARGALALVMATSAVASVFSGRYLFASAYYARPGYGGPAGPLESVCISWALTLVEGAYAATAVGVYHLRTRGTRDVRSLVLGFGLVVVSGIIVVSVPLSRFGHRHPAGMASVVGNLRTINTAEITYASTYDTGYSPSLAALAPPTGDGPSTASAAGLIDSVLAGGIKSGYTFTYLPGPRDENGRINSYTLSARPLKYTPETRRSFFTDESGVIRQTDEDRPATAQDSPIP